MAQRADPPAGTGGSALRWTVGTLLLTAVTLVWFHRWGKPYLNVENEGEVQVFERDYARVAAEVSAERLGDSVRALASFGSRLSGSEGADRAADWLKGQLRGILGAAAVSEETFPVDNPFDLGCVMDAGAGVFRVHPMWAPYLATYRLPAEGRALGTAVETSLAGLLRGSGLRGTAAVVPWFTPADLRRLVLAVHAAGAFNRELRDPLTKGELAVLAGGGDDGAANDAILDLLAEKHQAVLAEFLFARLKSAGVRSLILVEPAGPAVRPTPRSFADRVLKYPDTLPRYLVPARSAGAVKAGAAVRVRSASSQVTLLESGESLRVYPLWPNHVRTSSTPRAGLEGRLVWAGNGSLDEVKGQDLRGAIVLVSFNCGYQWVTLADLGAAAILFAEPAEIMRGETENKYLTIPADIPRFWIPAGEVAKLRAAAGQRVRVAAQVVWERRAARTIVARLKGTGKATDPDPVVMHAHYDSISVVPDLAPGGDQACGPAALLELARVLKRRPLKKDTIFVLTQGHAQNVKGWTSWLHRHWITKEKTPADPEYVHPAFVVDLDLSTRTRRLAVFFKGHRLDHNQDPIKRVYSSFGKVHAANGAAAAKTLGYGDAFMVDAVNAVSGRTWDSYVPGQFAIAQEWTVNAGLYGLTYLTPDDERVWMDTPHDTPGRMDLDSLVRQTRVLACTLPNQLNVGAAFSSSRVTNYWSTLKGRVVEWVHRESFLPDKSVNGAIVWVHHHVPQKSLKGVRGNMFVMALGPETGGAAFELHGMGRNGWLASQWRAHTICEAYECDPLDGEVRYAPDRGPQGTQTYSNEATMNEKAKDLTLTVFPCRPMLFSDLVDPLRYTVLARMEVFDARTESPPSVYGLAQPETNGLVTYVEPLAMAFAPEGLRLKFTFWATGLLGKRCALVNGTDARPEGDGFRSGEVERVEFTARQVAEDMWRLNDFRLRNLEKFGIVNHYLAGIHAQAKARLETMRTASRNRDWRTAVAEARAAWGLSARVYPAVEQSASDIVRSAMLLLALLIPFAFLAERLLFAFNNVSKQVAGALGVFFAMFGLLWLVHPAFRIALTPFMILLAFIIIALSIVVAGMIGNRFFDFLREEREALAGVHKQEASKGAVALAAFSLGVSNMRKRPLRTLLTCLTLVVLTFAVLSLTSVQTAVKQKRFSIGKPAGWEGLLFRSPGWQALADPALKHLETELAGVATPVPRAWYVSYAADRQNAVEIATPTGERVTAVAALGLSHLEPSVTHADRILTAGRWFGRGDARVVLLPKKLAEALKIGLSEVGSAQVVIFGVPFTVVGLFDPGVLGRIRDIDDEELTPANFEASEKRRQTMNVNSFQPEGQLPQKYDHHDAAQLVIMPYADLMRLNGRLASIAVPVRDAESLGRTIDKLLSRLGLLVYVGIKGRTWAYSAIGATPTEGLSNLIAPIAIALCIMVSTMLGAVQERRREIAVFSSVGLSPMHVGFLFIAEAFVYAILGIVVGYLVGLAFSHLVVSGVILKGLNVNYSSNSAFVAVLAVSAIVMISAAYPAWLASKLARPSQETGFVLPPLVGDRVSLELPFSFNARDAQAVCAFLAEFFDAHAEASAGEFSAGEIRIGRAGAVNVLHARVWLAPYDFGVSQTLTFRTREGIGDASSATLEITRLSGDQQSWRRVNGRFLKNIRKQFLIWRALGDGARARYQKTAARMAAAPAGTREPVGSAA